MTHVNMLVPFLNSSPITQYTKDAYKQFTDMNIVGTDTGLETVNSLSHLARMHGPIVEKAIDIEKKGNCDALIIGCFGEPALMAVRQVVSMPVLGPCEASLAIASLMGHKIVIITPGRQFLMSVEQRILAYQFGERVIGIRVADFPVENVLTRPKEVAAEISQVCLRSIHEDNADVLIMGCIGFSWIYEEVRKVLAKEQFNTPIIEPGVTVYHAAKVAVQLGLNQDRRKLLV